MEASRPAFSRTLTVLDRIPPMRRDRWTLALRPSPEALHVTIDVMLGEASSRFGARVEHPPAGGRPSADLSMTYIDRWTERFVRIDRGQIVDVSAADERATRDLVEMSGRVAGTLALYRDRARFRTSPADTGSGSGWSCEQAVVAAFSACAFGGAACESATEPVYCACASQVATGVPVESTR